MSRQSVGVTPSGSGHSPKGGAASASPAKPSVPNAAAFTPGPWRLGYGPNDGDGFPKRGERQTEICCLPHTTYDALDIFARGTGNDDWEVAHSEPTFEEHFANGRLIAAAPEMYEALEPLAKLGRMLNGPFAPALFADTDAVGVGGAWSENGEPRTLTFGDLRRAAAALAKARGEQ